MTVVSQTVPEHLRWQAEACARLGSPLYSALLVRAAEDFDAGGAISRVIGDRPATNASALGLRLMGSVHRLVLEGAAPALARTYPSTGGRADPEAAWPAFVAVVTSTPSTPDSTGPSRPTRSDGRARSSAGSSKWRGRPACRCACSRSAPAPG